ncbi:hypothetical protein CEXT_490091, partial [Caerostris extrusa]
MFFCRQTEECAKCDARFQRKHRFESSYYNPAGVEFKVKVYRGFCFGFRNCNMVAPRRVIFIVVEGMGTSASFI